VLSYPERASVFALRACVIVLREINASRHSYARVEHSQLNVSDDSFADREPDKI
jgi:hypothetical protein